MSNLILGINEMWWYVFGVGENHILHFNEPLRFLIKNRNDDEAKAMLNDLHLNKVHVDCGSLLHCASECNNDVIITALIELGAEVDWVGPDGNTPLMTAVETDNTNSVRALLKADANVHLVNAAGVSVLQMVYNPEFFNLIIMEAVQQKVRTQASNVEELVGKLTGAGGTMHHAAYLKDIEVLECMSRRGCGVDVRGSNGMTALLVAAQLNDLKLVKWLVDRGADVNALDDDDSGALFAAVVEGNTDMVRFMLERGADPNGEDIACEWTPFFSAVKYASIGKRGSRGCIELLVEYGAVPQNAIGCRETIFDYALRCKSCWIVNLLIGHLSVLERLGTRDTKNVMYCSKMKHSEAIVQVRGKYELCQRMLDVAVFEKMTLFDLLIEGEMKMKILLRNGMFVSRVEDFCSVLKVDELYSYYYKKLKKSIDKAKKLLELENAAISTICYIFGGNYNQHYIAARCIVNYLDESDFIRMTRI